MRRTRPSPAALLALPLTALLTLASLSAGSPGALARKPSPNAAAKTEAAQQRGKRVEISGRVAVGLDKTFIKDPSLGYLMVQGADLTRFAGRHIRAKAMVVRQEREFRVVRLIEYSILSPDDDSPGTSARKK